MVDGPRADNRVEWQTRRKLGGMELDARLQLGELTFDRESTRVDAGAIDFNLIATNRCL